MKTQINPVFLYKMANMYVFKEITDILDENNRFIKKKIPTFNMCFSTIK